MPKIMLIFNATPDSFYGPSRYNDAVFADAHADIIDIGACSTRPGSNPVDAGEEWGRLEPVLCRLLETGFFESGKELSIDTFRPGIVTRVLDLLGREFIVNDPGVDPDSRADMISLCRARGLRCIVTHNGPASETLSFFSSLAPSLDGLDWILDPGLGFGKDDPEENWWLLRNLREFKRFGRPILVGASLKRFTRGTSGLTREANRIAVRNGADILRVHASTDALNLL